MQLSRRRFLAASAASFGFGIGMAGSGQLSARTPAVEPFKKLDLGPIQLYLIHDGNMVIPPQMAARDRSLEELKPLLEGRLLPDGMAWQPVNVAVLQTESDLIVIDVGAGPNFMEGLGKLTENMEKAGLDPDAVSKVVFTHAHPDHLWGALDEFEDGPRFPNAEHLMAEAELDFWRAEDTVNKLPAERQSMAVGARRIILKLDDRLKTFKPGTEPVKGLLAVDTAGHTEGHVSFEVTTDEGPLLILGDSIISPTISFAHPDWQPGGDHLPEAAAATRKRLLDRMANDRARFVGYHLHSARLARTERAGNAYRLAPI